MSVSRVSGRTLHSPRSTAWSTEGFGNASSDKRKVFTRRIALRTQNHGDHLSIGIGRSSSDDGRFDGWPRRRFPSCRTADEGNRVSSSGLAKGEVSCCAGFRMSASRALDALGRPASEKRQGTKSREVGRRRCRGLYGDLAAGSGWARLDQSGRPNRFGPWDGCGRRAERTERALLDRVGGATAGRFVDLQEAGAVLAESQPEWRASLGWSQLVPFSRPEPGPDRCHSRDFGRQRPRDPAETDSAAEGGGSNFPFRVVNEHRTAPIGFLLTL